MTRTTQSSGELNAFERQAQICKAFAHPTRFIVLHLLGRREWAAQDLQETLGVSKANLSQHVAILSIAGLLLKRRQGSHLYLSLALPEVKWACELIRNVLRAQIRAEHVLL
jgi:ArsR family transcriptional regulator